MDKIFNNKPYSTIELARCSIFAELLCKYHNLSIDLQNGVDDMADILVSPDSTDDEKNAAVATIAEALLR
jgi:recombinational DNA repair protein RecT